MTEARQILESIIADYSVEKFSRFFREKSRQYVTQDENYARYNDADFKQGIKLGELNFSQGDSVMICAFTAQKELSERSGKQAQYEKAKSILRSSENQKYSAGIFIFYDKGGNFRFSLVYPETIGIKKQWNNFRRFTYFVSTDPQIKNRTFLKQIGEKEFAKLDDIKSAFSITAVTNLFYDEFFKIYDRVVNAVIKRNNISEHDKARDFVLLFVIRTVFIGFIQKKKWLGDDENFIKNFFSEYRNQYYGKDEFFKRWLAPLFFEALNTSQGHKVAYRNNEFSKETEAKLEMAPYLNGGLFKEKRDYDNNGWIIPDVEVGEFFDFLFAHSFTIEENSLDDEDLQLNPEFLGIIFERLVNKADGAVYTPRTEVDLMCRLSLVKWLQKNLENPVKADNLYELFFRESEKEEDQKQGSFSPKEAQEILNKLENLAICDPAVGSGAFLVGMMQVLDETEQVLKKYVTSEKNTFERKKEIIRNSLYGVEVKEWAVWICQLRLWLSLFVDAPDGLKNSFEPILPSLDFKVRQGDSLVQRVGSKAFPVSGHNQIMSPSVRRKITELKSLKVAYFDNKSEFKILELKQKERDIYDNILDSEISEKEEVLRKLKNIKPIKLASLFGEEIEDKQEVLELNKEQIDALEGDIYELREQKRALRNGNKPLVWSIEFAEVFAEKDGFDIVIGNPPYVRQEKIEDPMGKIKDKKEYKNCLEEMVKIDFPSDFSARSKINAQSDLYTYFYIRALRLLNPQGIQTFICSNSWLDVGYGVWLQEFFLKWCSIDVIIDNHAKRSFDAADVNTIISIIHAPQKKVDENKLVKFIAFKKPFEEAIFTENLLAIENAQKVESNTIFRVYPITVKDLKEAGMIYDNPEQKVLGGKYEGDKWGGKYLRAPDIFFTILEKGKGKLVKLSDIAEVRRGFTTGANEFFYLSEEKISQWGIEQEFLKPVIKSPRECKSVLVNPKDLKYKIFICNKSKAELSGTNALKYIEWGEKQKTEEGVLWKNVPSVSGRKYWYGLGVRKSTSFNFNYLIDHVGSTYVGDIYVSDNFHEIHTEQKNIDGFLNSTLFYLFQNLTGRIGFGGGLLKIQAYELQKLLVLTNAKKKGALYRDIESLFEECGIDPKSAVPIEEQEPKPLPDRAELDKIVFDALELTEKERKEVYRAVCRLVWNRISKAKSV